MALGKEKAEPSCLLGFGGTSSRRVLSQEATMKNMMVSQKIFGNELSADTTVSHVGTLVVRKGDHEVMVWVSTRVSLPFWDITIDQSGTQVVSKAWTTAKAKITNMLRLDFALILILDQWI